MKTVSKVTQQDPRFVTALARGLAILLCFQQESHLTHQQICEKTQLPKATVSRLLFTLMATDFISQDEKKGVYYLGKQAFNLINHHIYQDIAQITTHLLKAFAERYQVSVNIAIHQADMMQYVACYRSPALISVNLQIGSQVPLESTAIGRAFYASTDRQTQHNIQHYLAQRLDKQKLTYIIDNLNEQVEFYQRHQFVVSDGEYSNEILAVATAVSHPKDNKILYALNASVPRNQWEKKAFIEKIVPALQTLSQQIQRII